MLASRRKYGIEAETNRVIARLIVPRIPRFSLFPFVQLIRPVAPQTTVRFGLTVAFPQLRLW